MGPASSLYCIISRNPSIYLVVVILVAFVLLPLRCPQWRPRSSQVQKNPPLLCRHPLLPTVLVPELGLSLNPSHSHSHSRSRSHSRSHSRSRNPNRRSHISHKNRKSMESHTTDTFLAKTNRPLPLSMPSSVLSDSTLLVTTHYSLLFFAAYHVHMYTNICPFRLIISATQATSN